MAHDILPSSTPANLEPLMSSQRQRYALVAFAAFIVGVILTKLGGTLASFNPLWYTDYREVIDAIGVSLPVVALVLTFPALFLASRHEKEMRVLLEKLGTQLIGRFPAPLADVALLIDSATDGDTIDILTDCADYGSFFAPAHHSAVFHAIGRARVDRHVSVRMLVSGHLHHITHNSPYWEKNFDDLYRDPEFRKHLNAFLAVARADDEFKHWLERHLNLPEAAADFLQWLNNNQDPTKPTGDLPSSLTAALLRELLATCHAICVEEQELKQSDGPAFTLLLLCREKYFEGLLRTVVAVDFRRSTEQTNLFFWMRSRHDTPQEAMFTYIDAGDDTRGLIFRTRERELLKVFRGAINRPRSLSGPHR
jgi:hypothetical protein